MAEQRTSKTLIIARLLIFIIGTLCLVWSALASIVTLSGNVEKKLIAGNSVSYLILFLKTVFGPAILGISAFAWLGVILILVALTHRPKTR